MIKNLYSPFNKRKINMIDLNITYLKFTLRSVSHDTLKLQMELFFKIK